VDSWVLHGNLYEWIARLNTRIDQLLERVGLSGFRDKALVTFSKGMLQRIGLAQALLNSPGLVFLDEPTCRPDPVGRILGGDIIRELRHKRAPVVFLNSPSAQRDRSYLYRGHSSVMGR